MCTNFEWSMVPSMARDYLRNLLGKRVSRLVRCSWWPADEVASQYGIPDEHAFSLTAGPLAIYFEDGAILGLASDPALNSVIVWDEAASRANNISLSLDADDELFAIPDHGPFAGGGWENFAGLTLSEFIILKRVAMSSKEQNRPSEIGLRLKFNGDASFIASHGLHNRSDDFSVLEGYQLPKMELREIPLA